MQLSDAEQADELRRQREKILEDAQSRFPNVYDEEVASSPELLDFLREHSEPEYFRLRKLPTDRFAHVSRGRVIRAYLRFLASVSRSLRRHLELDSTPSSGFHLAVAARHASPPPYAHPRGRGHRLTPIVRLRWRPTEPRPGTRIESRLVCQ